MNLVPTFFFLFLVIAVAYSADVVAKQPIKSVPKTKPVFRRMWTPNDHPQLSDSPIFRALSSMDQQAEPFDFYPSYGPVYPSMLPRNFYQDPMEQTIEHWMQAQQKAEQRNNNNNKEGIDGAIYIPALVNGAFGGPITIVNPQGQQSQEELISPVNNGNSVESGPSTNGECRSGLQNQQPYYPQFRSPYHQPGQEFYYNDMMASPYYPLSYPYPGQFNYFGYL